jgi:hypothetical protein
MVHNAHLKICFMLLHIVGKKAKRMGYNSVNKNKIHCSGKENNRQKKANFFSHIRHPILNGSCKLQINVPGFRQFCCSGSYNFHCYVTRS